jgi:hypothetical protein
MLDWLHQTTTYIETIMAAPISLTAATTLEQQAYLVALALQTQELAIPIETRPNNTQLAFDTEAATVTISITLETLMTVAGGTAVIAAKPYLA